MPLICWLISPVALAVCSASAFTSDATTAKPRPASPARAASMVAFNASRLVCPAMVLINSTTSPIRVAAFASSPTRSLVFRACSTASLASRRNHGGELLRTLCGRRQRTGGGFQLGRGRRHDFDNFANHRFEVAGNLVDAPPAPDLCIGLHRGLLVGGFLGDEGLLEDLQR